MPGKIILFEEDAHVREFLKYAVEKIPRVRSDGINVVADCEPWSAKDTVDLETQLVITGSSNHSQEWDALSYARDVPANIPVVAGRAVWDYELRKAFAYAGAIFTYEAPFRYKNFETMITAALKYGAFLRADCCEKGRIVATHLAFDADNFIIEKF
jgi:hypothetical protein